MANCAHDQDMFQSTPLREGRPNRHMPLEVRPQFQSTPLREGRRVPGPKLQTLILFQSTPLREGRHDMMSGGLWSEEVSIHAPA